MKSSKSFKGAYYLTGYMGDILTQYSIFKINNKWKITRVYGNGPEFYSEYDTKNEAYKIIMAYSN